MLQGSFDRVTIRQERAAMLVSSLPGAVPERSRLAQSREQVVEILLVAILDRAVPVLFPIAQTPTGKDGHVGLGQAQQVIKHRLGFHSPSVHCQARR
jgi:hypothetical protein